MMNYMTRDADGIAAIIAHTVPGGLQVLFTLIALSWIIGSASPLLLVMILSVTVAYVALGRYFAPRLRQGARDRANGFGPLGHRRRGAFVHPGSHRL